MFGMFTSRYGVLHFGGSLSLDDLCARVCQVFGADPLPLLSVNVSWLCRCPAGEGDMKYCR